MRKIIVLTFFIRRVNGKYRAFPAKNGRKWHDG